MFVSYHRISAQAGPDFARQRCTTSIVPEKNLKPGRAAIEPGSARCHIAGMTRQRSDVAEPSLPEPKKPESDKPSKPREIGGPKGPEPTRYGDWEIGGRCIDF